MDCPDFLGLVAGGVPAGTWEDEYRRAFRKLDTDRRDVLRISHMATVIAQLVAAGRATEEPQFDFLHFWDKTGRERTYLLERSGPALTKTALMRMKHEEKH